MTTALREATGPEEIVGHPRDGVVSVRLEDDAADVGDAVVSAGTAAAPDASVEVARGRPPLHQRAGSLRDAGRVALERRVVAALGGRERSWAGDYV